MPTRLSDEQIAFFNTEGYLRVPDLFLPEDLFPLRDEIAGIVDGAARHLAAAGTITETYDTEPLETRLTRLMAAYPEQTGAFMQAIEGRAGGGHTGREMFGILTHPKLLDALEDLLGPEIVGSSVYRIRPKVPGFGRGVVPWHQDSGYFAAHCDENLIVTCWIPLVDATPENGCLQVLPRTHRRGIAPHHTGGPAGYLVIEDADLPAPPDAAVTVPVPLGGVLLLSNLTPHCSTPNTTDVIRWSVDLRYQHASVPHNLDQEPEAFDPDAPAAESACYPPEGDFRVRGGGETPITWETWAERRARYEAARPAWRGRGWQPVGAGV